MKLICLIFCTVFLFAGSILAASSGTEYGENELRGIVDGFINDTLNQLINSLADPLTVNDTSLSFNNAILTGTLSISDFQIDGLKSIVASYINVHYNIWGLSKINLTIGVGDITLFTNYEMDLILGQILPFFGKGNLSFTLDKISTDIYTQAGVVLLPTKITGFQNFSLEFSVGEDTGFSIEGLMDNDDFTEIVNDIISEFTPRIIDFLNTNKDRIGAIISAIIQDILDSVIKYDSFEKLCNIIQNNYKYYGPITEILTEALNEAIKEP